MRSPLPQKPAWFRSCDRCRISGLPVTHAELIGLFDLREKMHHLGGTLDIRSRPDEGTEVIMSVPLG